MIGNDVIDLALAQKESNWRRKGYLDKIFTSNEQKFIFSSENQTIMVWTLWSRKEAVYKIIRQQNGVRGFYPLKIENCDFENGIVCFEDDVFYAKTSIIGECIHTIASQNHLHNQIIEISSSIQLFKKNEIPYIIENGSEVCVSKSYHGRYEKVIRTI
jgi:phosphopantetheinyl transferase (holo-ACP synthase)